MNDCVKDFLGLEENEQTVQQVYALNSGDQRAGTGICSGEASPQLEAEPIGGASPVDLEEDNVGANGLCGLSAFPGGCG